MSEVLSDEDVFGPGGAAASSNSAKSGVLSDEDVFGPAKGAQPGWGELALEAAKRGIHGNVEAARQTAQAVRGETPTPEAARPPDKFSPYLDEPYDFTSLPDANTPKKVVGKTVQGLVETAPEMGGAIAGGVAAGAVTGGNPLAVMGGAGGGAALVNAAKTIAPMYAQELKATPEDAGGALDRAIKKTAISAGATGAAFAAFENPFVKGELMRVLTNVFGLQPAIAAGQKAATNVVDDKPVLEGVGQAAGEGALATAVPLAAHAGIKTLLPRKAAPVAPPAAPEKPAPALGDWITGVSDQEIPPERPPLALPPPSIAMPDESHQPVWRNDGTIDAGPPDPTLALPPPAALDAVGRAQLERAASNEGVDALGPSSADPNRFVMTDRGGPPETAMPEPPPAAALPPPRKLLPRSDTTYGDGFTMADRARPGTEPEPQRALPPPKTMYGEGWAASDEANPRGTPLQRTLYGMQILDPGDPVTNSVLKNISGLTDLEQIKYLRKILVNRGLVEQKGVRYVRAGEKPAPAPAPAAAAAAAPAPASAPAPAETAPQRPVERAQPTAPSPTPEPPEAPTASPPSISEAVQGEAIGGRHVRDDIAVTPTGREVPVSYQVVEADKLVPSQRDDLAANPAYPAELQPRDRTRAASAQQVHDIATTLNPRLLDASPKASDGAPIVAPDGVVESGNGRTLALRRAYDQKLPSAEAYRQYLKAQGYPVDGMQKPVLVRVRTGHMGPEDRSAFVREANARETLGMSPTEQALSDGRALSPAMLDLFKAGDVASAGNRQFVQVFLRDIVGKTEAAQLMTPTGELSQRGKQRVEAALAGRAYEDANLIQAMIEDPDPGIKAIGGAMMDVAGQWAKMRSEAQAETINPKMDITANLVQAAQLVRRARDQGRNVAEFVGQKDMFAGDAVDPRTESILRMMFRDPKFTKPVARAKMVEGLGHYVEQARLSKAEPGLFGAADVVGPDQILEKINARRQDAGADQADLLGGRPEPSGPGENASLRREEGRELPGRAAGEEARGSRDRQAHEVDTAARAADTEPTPAQKEAGNYRKGHVKIHGLDVTIENPKGSTRSGVDPNGKPWSVELPEHYGYIKRTTGQDGDHVDTYVGPNPASERVWVVDQVHERTRAPDEHKVMLGFDTRAQALEAYDRAFSDGKGPQRRGAVTELHVDELKQWLRVGDTKSPISDQLHDALRTRLDKMGMKDVAIRLVDQLKVKGETADGRYWKGVIDLARDNPDGMRGMLSVMGHEAVHGMRDLGLFKAGEWKAIEAWADRVGRKRYDIDTHYAKWGEAMRREEAFAHFVQDVLDGRVPKPAGLLARAVQKIRDFFEALVNAARHPFTEDSFTTAGRVAGKILSGEVGKRDRPGGETAAEPAAHLAPDDFFQKSAERTAAMNERAGDLRAQLEAGERVTGQDRGGNTLAATPATVGGIQVTKFENGAPVGHIVFKDAADAAKHMARETVPPEEMAALRAARQAEEREQAYPTHVRDSLNRWNGPNDVRPTRQRIAEAVQGIGRGTFERFYQQAVDRRAAFARNERARAKAGQFAADDITKDGDLHARVSAHKAAMMYDRESSFAEQALAQGPIQYDGMGFKASRSGGLLDKLAPVGRAGVWREFAAYERIGRAQRLAGEGRDKQLTPEDLRTRRYLEQQFPWFRQVHDEVQAFNNAQLKFLVDTGRLTPEKAAEWARTADYTPFYRELLEGSGGIKGPLHVDALTNDTSFRRLKGGDAQVGEYLENMTRNLRASIAAGLKNVAATRALRDAEALGLAERVKGNPIKLESASDIVRVYENGKAAYFKVKDRLTFDALEGMNGSTLNPLLKALGYPANLLRKLTTHSPTFLLVNHPMRESMQAFLTSRENVAPIISAVKGQIEVLRNSPLTQDLKAHGVGGGFDLTGGEGRARQHILRHYKGPDGILSKMWHGYERLIDSADLGVRTQIYQKEMKRLGGRAGDEYEAAIASLKQGVNFKQRGASEALRWATIAIPFLNARIQGLDTLGRAFVNRPAQTWAKAAMMVGLASAYYAWVRDNPTYQRASEQQKDENFLLPIPGTDKLFHLPAPFEAGILFKRIPERILRLIDGQDLPRDTKRAFFHAVLDSLHFNPIPQAVLPALEVATNHDFYTGREVVAPRLADLPVQQRKNDRTSEVGKGIGAMTGTAPLNVDHLLNGYFGTIGGYALFATDALVHTVKPGPSQPAKTTTQFPALGTVLKDARNIGNDQQNRFYDMKHEVDELVKGIAALKKTDGAKAVELQRENAPLLGAKTFTDNVGKALSKVRAQEVQVRASTTLSPDAKRARLDALDAQRGKLLERVETVRRKAYAS